MSANAANRHIWTKASCTLDNRDCTCADAAYAECSESGANTAIHMNTLEECIFQCEVSFYFFLFLCFLAIQPIRKLWLFAVLPNWDQRKLPSFVWRSAACDGGWQIKRSENLILTKKIHRSTWRPAARLASLYWTPKTNAFPTHRCMWLWYLCNNLI